MCGGTNFDRAHNFFAGPAVLPEPVLERVRNEFMNFKDMKLSVVEISHRSDQWEETVDNCVARIRNLLGVPDNYEVLFLQGGASTQFGMIPMNIARNNQGPVQVVDTGRWSNKKMTELDIQDIPYNVLGSSEETNYDRIPDWDKSQLNSDAAYFHICSNETIGGIQWQQYPDTGDVPLVADMSSDIMSREIDVEDFGLIYAGAQKNIGPAGAALVIIRDDLIERTPDDVPTMLRYDTHVKKNSMHNTPPVFTIYMINLVMQWLEEQGGIKEIEEKNEKKAGMIYDLIDSTDFYRGAAQPNSRSLMNVTFRLPSEELEDKFVKEAEKEDLIGLKGHRTVGGCRASIYNSQPIEGVEALCDFMEEFEQKNG
ncbi:MAG: 3-phosphoserine/phosphohydroxythreonine transaminase [bacterium]